MRASLAGLLTAAALLAPHAAGAQAPDPRSDVPFAEARPLSAALVPSAPSARPRVAAEPSPAEGASPAWLAAGGVAGTMVGLAGGLVVGGLLAGPDKEGCESFCSGPELVGAGLGGEAIGTALGVHLANGRRGSLPLSMLTSAGILAAGVAGMQADRRVAYLIPFSQVLGSVYVERRTSRPRQGGGFSQ